MTDFVSQKKTERKTGKNTAFVAKGHIDLVKKSIGCIPKEIIFVDGASKNDLRCQVLLDVLNLLIKVPFVKKVMPLVLLLLSVKAVVLMKIFQIEQKS